MRAVACLQAVCGQLDVPGGAVLRKRPGPDFWALPLLPVLYRMGTPAPVPPALPPDVRPIGYDAHPLFEAFNRQAQATLFPAAILEGWPYPLRGLLLLGSNPVLTSPDTTTTRRALAALDLLVVVDPFLSATAEMADFVLPATTFLEGAAGDGPDAASARSPMLGARHESRTEWEVIRSLAAALGLGGLFPWATLGEARAAPRIPYMDDPEHAIRPSGEGGSAAGPGGGSGGATMPAPRFPSVTGKVELRSETAARFGLPATPEWARRDAGEGADVGGDAGRERPFLLVSGPRTGPYISSQFRQVPAVARLAPAPTIRMHPAAAAALGGASGGLPDGARVAVVTRHGRMEAALELTDRVRQDVVVVPSGWPGAACANNLTSLEGRDPASGFPELRALPCRVGRA